MIESASVVLRRGVDCLGLKSWTHIDVRIIFAEARAFPSSPRSGPDEIGLARSKVCGQHKSQGKCFRAKQRAMRRAHRSPRPTTAGALRRLQDWNIAPA